MVSKKHNDFKTMLMTRGREKPPWKTAQQKQNEKQSMQLKTLLSEKLIFGFRIALQ